MKMKYTPAINIELGDFEPQDYIVTQNALSVVGNLVNAFETGIHSFNIIGSYGTGKSSFVLALEYGLTHKSSSLIQNKGQFNGLKKIRFLKIVGDYESLQGVLKAHLPIARDNNIFESLEALLVETRKRGEFLFIVIDEFGKLLEYAAKNNPDRELYLFQKFTEFINDRKKDVILLTTLHQNFNSYASGLTEEQRQEWNKVKGRFKEIVFNEPVEQLLYLAAKRIERVPRRQLNKKFRDLYDLAVKTRYVGSTVDFDVASALYPLDLFAAQALTLSIQRYGQNERTLFSFLGAVGKDSLKEFQETPDTTYSLADVYDYCVYNFNSCISDVNADSSAWMGIKVAIERVEGMFEEEVESAIKFVKTIGLVNLFGSAGVSFNKRELAQYACCALGIKKPGVLIERLERCKIIRYAGYRSRYVLFEGTDVDIEGELLKASGIVPRSADIIEKLKTYFDLPVEFANAAYFQRGTPRYFEYVLSDMPIKKQPQNEIDGYINLIFNEVLPFEKIRKETEDVEAAIIYAYFKYADRIIDSIWMLDKLSYVQSIIDNADRVAHREVKSLIHHEKKVLNTKVLDVLFGGSDEVIWFYRGRKCAIASKTVFNKKLSQICNEVYSATPVFLNEMVNKHKPSGTMSTARINLLSHLLDNVSDANLGFEEKFPPEKTIFLTLLRRTGIHRAVRKGIYELGAPNDESFLGLWRVCEEFFESTKEKPRKLGELIELLRKPPLKLKQGVIDIWLPVYLIIKKSEFSLYSDQGVYIPMINREVLDILQKAPTNYQVKAFEVDGVKLDLFNRYREMLNFSQDGEFTGETLLETIKPFLVFYKRLNRYAKHTKRLKKTTVQFRDVLSVARDPEKTFFEDLPQAFGFKNGDIVNNDEALRRYVALLQDAIRDLRSCYDNMVNRIEKALVAALDWKSDFSQYKQDLEGYYKGIKTYLLTDRQKALYARIMSSTQDKIVWYQSLSYLILDKQLDDLLDEEEPYLVDNLIYAFKELEKFIDISARDIKKGEGFVRFEIISSKGQVAPQIIHPNKAKLETARRLEIKVKALLSGDNEIDAYTLVNILKNRFSNE